MTVQRIRMDQITVRDRHRKELGDIKAFAGRIKERGMLHPPVVKKYKSGYLLLAGERRFRAWRQLGESMIQANVVDADSRLDELLVERDENDDREEMKPSEKVSLAQEIEEIIGNRKGGKTIADEVREIFPQLDNGKKTAEVAAEEAGFGNVKTYQQAASVVEHGTEELVEAMDAGEVSIADAAKIAKKPKRTQRKAVNAVKRGDAKTAAGAVTQIEGPKLPQNATLQIKAQEFVHVYAELRDGLQQVVEGAEGKLRDVLEKQRKRLGHLVADIDLALGKSAPSNGKFVPPTVEQVAAYVAEVSAGIDAEQFVDYYAARGWKAGKVKMTDWKAAVRTWKHNRKGFGNGRISRVEAPKGKYDGIGITVGKAESKK